jgi:hypothetical protein
VFRQDERRKPKQTDIAKLAAIVYWSARAQEPSAKDAHSIALVRKQLPEFQRRALATIRKLAQRHRRTAFKAFDAALVLAARGQSLTIAGATGDVQLPTEAQLRALREHLKKKQAREN